MANNRQDYEKTIHCSNCNAEYDASLETCPYCGAENKKKVIKEQYDYLKGLHDKTVHADEIVINERAEKGSIRVSKGARIAVAAAVIIIAVTFIISAVRSAVIAANREKLLVTLEKQYQINDYEAMERTMERSSAYNNYSSTQKYRNLVYVYRDIKAARKAVNTAISDAEEYGGGTDSDEYYVRRFAGDIAQCYEPLCDLNKYEEDGYRYREQKGVEYLRNEIISFMEDTLKLSSEEIDEGLEAYLRGCKDGFYEYDSNELIPFAGKVIEKLNG